MEAEHSGHVPLPRGKISRHAQQIHDSVPRELLCEDQMLVVIITMLQEAVVSKHPCFNREQPDILRHNPDTFRYFAVLERCDFRELIQNRPCKRLLVRRAYKGFSVLPLRL